LKKVSYQKLEKEYQELKGELESRLRLFDILADALPDVIYVIDPDSTIIEVNKSVENYGYTTDELRGRPFSDFVPDEFKEMASQVVKERREKITEVEDSIRKKYSQTVEIPFIDKSNKTIEMQASGETFMPDFEVQTIRIHKGEPIKKNHIYTIGIARDVSEQKKLLREKEQLITDLKEALAEVKQLSGLLPICASCKKIRDDQGYWNQIESYIEKRSEAQFSHSVCPDCAEKLYGNTEWYKKKKENRKTLVFLLPGWALKTRDQFSFFPFFSSRSFCSYHFNSIKLTAIDTILAAIAFILIHDSLPGIGIIPIRVQWKLLLCP